MRLKTASTLLTIVAMVGLLVPSVMLAQATKHSAAAAT